MNTNYTSENNHFEERPYLRKEDNTGNNIFGVMAKALFVIIVVAMVFMGLVSFGVISLKDDIVPTAILLSQNEVGIKKGKNFQLNYAVYPEDATNKRITWESSDPSIAIVNEKTGYITALKEGTVTIFAKTEINEVVSECLVNVTNKSVGLSKISFNNKNASLAVGHSINLSYTTVPSNASQPLLTYSSSDPSVAVVNKKGVITGIGEGNAIITVSANNGNVTDTAYITVYKLGTSTVSNGEALPTEALPESLSVAQDKLSMLPNTSARIEAIIEPYETTDVVNWSSSNSLVASVDETGLITSKAVGTTKIVATTVNGLTQAIDVDVSNYSQPLKKIEVTPSYTTLKVNYSKQLYVLYTPSNASNKNVAWTTSDSSVATVDSTGIVKAVGSGNVSIKATSNDGGFTSVSNIEVKGQTNVINPTGINFGSSKYFVGVNNTVALNPTVVPSNATYKTVLFASEDPSIATVDSNGVVTGHKVGTTKIFARTPQNGIGTTIEVEVSEIPTKSIAINDSNITISVGDFVNSSVTYYPAISSNKTSTYISSNSRVASIDTNGIIYGLNKGRAVITVMPNGGGKPATIIVTVE